MKLDRREVVKEHIKHNWTFCFANRNNKTQSVVTITLHIKYERFISLNGICVNVTHLLLLKDNDLKYKVFVYVFPSYTDKLNIYTSIFINIVLKEKYCLSTHICLETDT